jgi:hypothetical protein
VEKKLEKSEEQLGWYLDELGSNLLCNPATLLPHLLTGYLSLMY